MVIIWVVPLLLVVAIGWSIYWAVSRQRVYTMTVFWAWLVSLACLVVGFDYLPAWSGVALFAVGVTACVGSAFASLVLVRAKA